MRGLHALAVSSLGAFSVENLCHIYRLGPVMPFDAHQTFLLSGIVQIGGRDSDPRVCRDHERATAGAEGTAGQSRHGKRRAPCENSREPQYLASQVSCRDGVVDVNWRKV